MKTRQWKSSIVSFSLIVLLSSCATTKLPQVVTFDQATKEVEAKSWVPTKIEDEPDFKAGTSEVVKKGTVIVTKTTVKNPDGTETVQESRKTLDGARILIDKDRSLYYAALKARRDRLRASLQTAEKQRYIDNRILESTIENLKARAKQQSTWWEKNKGLVGLAFGSLVGMAITVGLVYALNKGQGVNTTSSGLKGIRF